MHRERDPISRAFYLTFGAAVAIELLSSICTWLGWYSTGTPAISIFWWVAQYGPIFALGFLLGRANNPYRTAFANVWPFVILWFVVGIITMRMGEMPPEWDAEKQRGAQWGYLLASVLFLPLAFVAAALGVWIARRFQTVRPSDSNAA